MCVRVCMCGDLSLSWERIEAILANVGRVDVTFRRSFLFLRDIIFLKRRNFSSLRRYTLLREPVYLSSLSGTHTHTEW